MLELVDVHSYYGTSHVLVGVSLALPQGGSACLLGRNGVGKSTTIRSVMGFVEVRSGDVRWRGKTLVGHPPYEVAALGIGYVHEDRRIFPGLTVQGNLEIAARVPPGGRRYVDLSTVYDYFPLLRNLRHRRGRQLSGGEQQLLAIARALMGNPSVLLLDEPTKGLAPVLVQELSRLLRRLNRELGVAILLAEQNVRFAFSVADYAYVMEKGAVRLEGPVSEMTRRPQALERYLAV